MRAIIQRVRSAQVSVNGSAVGSIDRGIMVLVGVTHEDTPQDMEYIAKKILTLRLFGNPTEDGGREDGKWAKSTMDRGFQVLLVSQFTLFANTHKGTKPDFHGAMKSDLSRPFFDEFVQLVKNMYKEDRIQTGAFGEYMQVNLTNDGPVTIILDSHNK